ncbi:L-lysine 6-monooxygenase [Streptomyces sp. ERV7]|uniref:lysine N(6)-hydroxylase/L-ornithine N(5)-oxygenase family protein n=1 Tax=Streptomyces sp. ERV7 TaxID=1322334 RepID=UPI0007F46547|nr:SidA/IucD/PvdA family monooxygenase [Streptomyces sp. ERV7]OAR26946.1 L-lysine 6-monooxygenase [Streptomyces sp. ERV7]
MTNIHRTDQSTKDLIGIGFGPANLALATAIDELTSASEQVTGTDTLFFEKQPMFGWHRGMLIDGATLQVSFLKDLVTLRNPTSQYSFTSYLHRKNRLVDFINSKTFYPLRTEFHEYLEWVAGNFASSVAYGHQVLAVRPVRVGEAVQYLDVEARGADGTLTTHRTRNVVLGTGLTPHLPDGVVSSRRIWHSGELLERTRSLSPGDAKAFAVVGAGQSAAEVAEYLHQSFPRAEIHAVLTRYGYSVADDSPFANRIFDPSAVDDFFSAPEDVKQRLLAYHSNTNYAVVDLDLSQSLYRTAYREKVSGGRRLHLHNVSRVSDVEETAGHVNLTVGSLPDSTAQRLQVDCLVYATGYRPADPLPLLAELEPEIKKDDNGRPALTRDYRVVTTDGVRCGIYIHGAAAEHSHGLSAGLLSNVAVRAGEVAQSIAARTTL